MATASCSLRARAECRPARAASRALASSPRALLSSSGKPLDTAAAPVAFPLLLRSSVKQLTSSAVGVALSLSLLSAGPASARLEGVNNPQLLPPGPPVPVLDVAGFLGKNQVARLTKEVQLIEAETGVRLRVLAQAYPNTPGLAVRDYWAVDDDTVVFVADPVTGNILNFNVGKNIDLRVPRSFWNRLAGKYGTKFYWQNNGEEAAIEAAVNAIDVCLHEPPSKNACATIAGP